jgi:uncharacterized protein (TIGR02452 family)
MDLVAVWESTKQHYVRMPPQDSNVIDDLCMEKYIASPKPFGETKINWMKADCIDVAINLKQKGLHPLLLNMASDFQPGGGVWKGATAQEEELFRRSNYHKFLHRRWYPFPTYRTILSQDVEFYRGSASMEYEKLPTPVHLDCIAVAGIRRPETTVDGRFKKSLDASILLKKLRILFQVAIENGNDALILSALGCGAFRGPVQHIAEIFRRVVEENRGRFKEITFAILGENYGKFRRSFENAPLS